MDCCKNKDSEPNMKGGKYMEIKKNTLMWVVIAVLFIATLFLTFKTGNIGTASSTTQVAAATARSAASQMVGGR